MARVIAYFMHEQQREAARQRMTRTITTDSYVVGDITDAQAAELRQRGMIVEAVDVAAPAETPGGDWEVVPGVRNRPAGAVARGAEETHVPDLSKPNVYLIQIRGPLMAEWRDALAHPFGVQLLEHIPHNYYTAMMTQQQAAGVRGLDFVASVRLYDEADTGQPAAAARAETLPGGRAMLTFDVRLHRAEDLPGLLAWLVQQRINIAGAKGRKVRLYLLADDPLVGDIAARPEVAAIEEYKPPRLHNDVARKLLGVDNSAPTNRPIANLSQTGKGEIVAVADTGIDEAHPDFRGRIAGVVALGRPGNASDPHGHGTHVAGSVLGSGAASRGKLRGVAPEAKLFFQSLLDAQGGLGGLPLDLSEMFEEAYQNGARIHNNSWGAATESYYTVNSLEVDEFVANRRDMLIVISAGNEGTAAQRLNSAQGFVDWLSMDSPASAKNALTVGASRSTRTSGGYSQMTWGQAWPNDFPHAPIAGEKISGNPEALAAFSSRGPVNDRRIKPDVVGPGTDIVSAKSSRAPLRHFWGAYPDNSRYAYMGGTSMAAPLVTGCATLIRQYYVQDRTHHPSAALLKATLINSTRWLSSPDAVADHSQWPNYHQGFGCIYMPWAIPNAAEPAMKLSFVDSWQTPALQFSSSGQRFRFRVTCAGGARLRFCLAWTDLPGRGLQNDLNLFVQDMAGQMLPGNPHLPARITATDCDNNVESVRLDNPPAGDYMVQITAKNILRGPQDFALVVTGDLTSDLVQL
jgi:subtilisin family serine protease